MRTYTETGFDVSQVLRKGEAKNTFNLSLTAVLLLLEYSAEETAMPQKKKTVALEKRGAEELRQEKEAQAENRRQLLASLSPQAKEFAEREFAKLGLYQ